MCQHKYCLNLLSDCGLTASKPVSTPLDSAIHLHQDGGQPYSDIPAYHRLVGRLLYLTTTRPDISFATQQLGQIMAHPTTQHHKAAMRLVHYLKSSPGWGLFFPCNSTIQLLGFSDVDWGSCVDSRKSISGYYFFLGHSLISWKSKKQTIVSRSSAKAEYHTLTAATCQLQWITYLLKDFHVTC